MGYVRSWRDYWNRKIYGNRVHRVYGDCDLWLTLASWWCRCFTWSLFNTDKLSGYARLCVADKLVFSKPTEDGRAWYKYKLHDIWPKRWRHCTHDWCVFSFLFPISICSFRFLLFSMSRGSWESLVVMVVTLKCGSTQDGYASLMLLLV